MLEVIFQKEYEFSSFCIGNSKKQFVGLDDEETESLVDNLSADDVCESGNFAGRDHLCN